jgi:hypothetical protein
LTTGHHNIPWDILSFPLREPHAGGLDDLIIELKAAQESVAVISSEAFEYLVQDPEKLRQFHERLVGIGYDPTYLVFFRNKSDYVRSLYYELMKHNVDKSIEWFEAEIKAKGSITVHGGWHHEFDYDRFVAKWKSAVGDAIVAFNYDEVSKHPGLIPFFFEKIGAPAEIVTASANLPLLNRSEAASARTGSREE